MKESKKPVLVARSERDFDGDNEADLLTRLLRLNNPAETRVLCNLPNASGFIFRQKDDVLINGLRVFAENPTAVFEQLHDVVPDFATGNDAATRITTDAITCLWTAYSRDKGDRTTVKLCVVPDRVEVVAELTVEETKSTLYLFIGIEGGVAELKKAIADDMANATPVH